MSDAATRAAYERDGYLVERGVLSAADLDPVRGLLADQVGDYARKMHAEGNIDSLFEDEPFARRFAAICAAMDSSPRGWIGNTLAKVYYDLFRHPGITRVLGAILGPEVSELGGLNVRTKIPEAEITAFPWHQDSHYYNEPARGRRVGRTEAAHIVTVWVPLVDATVANGCIWVMPGSHRWGLVDAARGEDMNVRTDEEIEQRGTPVALEMAAGDVLYLTNLTFHTSKMNRTEDSRWSVDFRFHVTATALDGPQRDAMEEFGKRQRSGGRVPLPVLSASAVPSWEEWQDATLQLRERNARSARIAQNAQIAARGKA